MNYLSLYEGLHEYVERLPLISVTDAINGIKNRELREYASLMHRRDAPDRFYELERRRVLAARPATNGLKPAFAFRLKIFDTFEDFINPFARAHQSPVICNHFSQEGGDYFCNCALAGTTLIGSPTFQSPFVGLVNGANGSYQTSGFTDTGSHIVSSGTPGGGQNQWIELTNYSGTTRQALGGLTYGTVSGSTFQLVGFGTPPSFVGGGGGGSVSGAFFIAGASAQGASTASFYTSSGVTNGPNLLSTAIGSPTAFSAGQTIAVTSISLTLTLG